jgi:DNA-binding IclR family transcriptional regulator
MAGGNLVQSLLRGIDIVNSVLEAKNGITLQALSVQLNLNNTTVYNLIRTLVHRNWLRKDVSGHYFIGNSIIDMAVSSSNRNNVEQYSSMLLELSQQYSEATITISECSAGEIWCRRRISPDRPGILQEPENQKFMPYTSASGLLFQAMLSSDIFEIIEERYPFYEFGIGAWGSKEKLWSYLKKAKSQRFASAPHFSTGKGVLLAVPLKSSSGDIAYTVGFNIKGKTISEKEIKRIADKIKRMTRISG